VDVSDDDSAIRVFTGHDALATPSRPEGRSLQSIWFLFVPHRALLESALNSIPCSSAPKIRPSLSAWQPICIGVFTWVAFPGFT
jgi:hypothetical protein